MMEQQSSPPQSSGSDRKQRVELNSQLMKEFFGDRLTDTTEQHLGKTTLIFTKPQSNLQDDSAEAMMRNLNRRKGSKDKP